jgi:hypothetical protein
MRRATALLGAACLCLPGRPRRFAHVGVPLMA